MTVTVTGIARTREGDIRPGAVTSFYQAGVLIGSATARSDGRWIARLEPGAYDMADPDGNLISGLYVAGPGGGGGDSTLFAYKTADETRDHAFPPLDDADLHLTLVPNSIYEYELRLVMVVTNNPSAGLSWSMQLAGDDSYIHGRSFYVTDTEGGLGITPETGSGSMGGGQDGVATSDTSTYIETTQGVLFTGDTTGDIVINWNSTLSSDDAASLLKGSFIKFTKRSA